MVGEMDMELFLFPSNIVAFLWRLIRHAPWVDSLIQSGAKVFASRFWCCQAHDKESLVHMLLKSDVAVAVWKCFSEIFRLPYNYSLILLALAIWICSVNILSQYGLCQAGVASYALWEIYVACCHATFEGLKMKAQKFAKKFFSGCNWWVWCVFLIRGQPHCSFPY